VTQPTIKTNDGLKCLTSRPCQLKILSWTQVTIRIKDLNKHLKDAGFEENDCHVHLMPHPFILRQLPKNWKLASWSFDISPLPIENFESDKKQSNSNFIKSNFNPTQHVSSRLDRIEELKKQLSQNPPNQPPSFPNQRSRTQKN